MAAKLEKRVVLAPGEYLRMPVESGTRLWVRAGRVMVGPPPQWLAQHLVVPQHCLVAEDSLVFEAAGWTTVQALAAAELAVFPVPTTESALWRYLGAWLRKLSRG